MAVYGKCICNYLFTDTPVTGCFSACVRKFPPAVMQQNQGEYGYVGVFSLFYILQAAPSYKILITKKRQSASASGHKSFYLTFISNRKKNLIFAASGYISFYLYPFQISQNKSIVGRTQINRFT